MEDKDKINSDINFLINMIDKSKLEISDLTSSITLQKEEIFGENEKLIEKLRDVQNLDKPSVNYLAIFGIVLFTTSSIQLLTIYLLNNGYLNFLKG
ncbi:MAG: hypothetical protein U9N59_10495 [Campylobacterota bacterium]|nr:hypothetical protein [Campylobacterota bacterium]